MAAAGRRPQPAGRSHDPLLSVQDEPHKQDDGAKSPPGAKEDGSMNILNSHSPKHDNTRPVSLAHEHGRAPNNTQEGAEVNTAPRNNLV